MNRQEIIEQAKRFEECGCCGQLHPHDYWGDCRNDDYRFNWQEVPEDKIRWLEED